MDYWQKVRAQELAAKLAAWSKLAGYELKTQNMAELWAAGAPRDIVTADKIPAQAYLMLSGSKLKEVDIDHIVKEIELAQRVEQKERDIIFHERRYNKKPTNYNAKELKGAKDRLEYARTLLELHRKQKAK